MIKGIGTDIIEIERIRKAMSRPSFMRRCFTEREVSDFIGRGAKVESVAGAFAGKEAISKALGTGFGRLSWQDVEIVKTTSGKPEVVLSENGWRIAKEKGIATLEISISHCRTYAVAFCTAEGA